MMTVSKIGFFLVAGTLLMVLQVSLVYGQEDSLPPLSSISSAPVVDSSSAESTSKVHDTILHDDTDLSTANLPVLSKTASSATVVSTFTANPSTTVSDAIAVPKSNPHPTATERTVKQSTDSLKQSMDSRREPNSALTKVPNRSASVTSFSTNSESVHLPARQEKHPPQKDHVSSPSPRKNTGQTRRDTQITERELNVNVKSKSGEPSKSSADQKSPTKEQTEPTKTREQLKQSQRKFQEERAKRFQQIRENALNRQEVSP